MKRLLITEEERNRILGLHKQVMVEQPVANPQDYAASMAVNALSKPISTKKGVMTPSAETQKTKAKQKIIVQNPYIKLDNQTFEGVKKTFNFNFEFFLQGNSDFTLTKDDFGLSAAGCSVPDSIVLKANQTTKVPFTFTLDPNENRYPGGTQRSIFTFLNRDKKIILTASVFSNTFKDELEDLQIDIIFSNVKDINTEVEKENTTQSKTDTPPADPTKNTSQSTSTSPQNSSQAKFNTTNDRAYEYKLEDGKYYFKGKAGTTYAKKYPNWTLANEYQIGFIKKLTFK